MTTAVIVKTYQFVVVDASKCNFANDSVIDAFDPVCVLFFFVFE